MNGVVSFLASTIPVLFSRYFTSLPTASCVPCSKSSYQYCEEPSLVEVAHECPSQILKPGRLFYPVTKMTLSTSSEECLAAAYSIVSLSGLCFLLSPNSPASLKRTWRTGSYLSWFRPFTMFYHVIRGHWKPWDVMFWVVPTSLDQPANMFPNICTSLALPDLSESSFIWLFMACQGNTSRIS